ncbi:chemotaxis protein CheW [Roseateles sp. BYS78W]|uniref:Chemotaxis protein CheW n=1 Tax=Pelomonas candidula TaxID=3299025 RepID=A0ABW7HFL1_9BURK
MNALVTQPGERPSASGSAAETRQYLTFMLGGEVFAIGILAIKEIIEYGRITPVPMMPATIRGVMNLRGAVVPVMDLAARFGRPSAETGKRTCIVIVERHTAEEQQVIGVVVDSVNAVQEIAAGDIEPAPGFGMRIAPQFIAGMGKVNSKFVILLDIEQVLSLHDMEQLQEA